MALIENITIAPTSGLVSEVMDKLVNLPGVGNLINILKAVGIVLFVYFIFLIIRTISQIKHNFNIKKIAQNVEEINHKMDILTSKKEKKNKK